MRLLFCLVEQLIELPVVEAQTLANDFAQYIAVLMVLLRGHAVTLPCCVSQTGSTDGDLPLHSWSV